MHIILSSFQWKGGSTFGYNAKGNRQGKHIMHYDMNDIGNIA